MDNDSFKYWFDATLCITYDCTNKGVWDIIVSNDDITVVKGFIFKRHWKFSSIEYAKAGRGGLKVYINGRKRKAFFLDTMCPSSQNFIERMEKEGKTIIQPM